MDSLSIRIDQASEFSVLVFLLYFRSIYFSLSPILCEYFYCQVDEERRRISLGMKKSYIGDSSEVHNFSGHSEDDEAIDDSAAMYSSLPTVQQNNNSPSTQKVFNQEDDGPPILSQAESRASVLPLQVSLDVSEGSDMDAEANEKQDTIEENNLVAKKRDRRERKKAKEERYVCFMYYN